jgi:geranylgeranyl diphosphate synthase type II
MIEACRYAALGGGKRVRPTLVLMSCDAVGGGGGGVAGAGDPATVAAVAVEFIHTFSLIHDDLPCMDDDDLRRGRPTLHVAMGERTAVLAGDLLLTEALAMLGRDVAAPALAARLVQELGQATSRMISGQSWDTEGGERGEDGGPDGVELLRRIHEHKTGALIRACCRMGGLAGLAARDGGIADGSSPPLAALTRYGEALGLLFQVTDDLLDVEQSAETIGKGSRKDAAAGKLTYPGLLGVDGARSEAGRLRREAESAAAKLGPEGGPLVALARLVEERTR